MHEVGALAVLGDGHVDAQGLQRGIGAGELGEVGVCRGAGLLARRPEAADLHVHVTPVPQGPDQLGDMHPGPSVDSWWVFLADDVDAHTSTVVIGPTL